MTLGKRIAEHRQRMGLSQEKLAEAVGVSRQAVTKWESDQTLPSSANLLRLADLFGTTADMLLLTETAPPADTASPGGDDETITIKRSQLLSLLAEDRRLRALHRRKTFQKNIIMALLVLLGYGLFYITGRFIWCSRLNESFLGWLFYVTPAGEHSYLYGWLLSSHMLWISLAVSTLPALFGRKYFAFVTLAGFWIGFGAGVLFGPNPAGAPYGFGHYGWAIWGIIFLVSVIVGLVLELVLCRRFRKKTQSDPLLSGF